MADWISALATAATFFVALWAARTGINTFRHQRTSSDITLALSIFDSINRYWDRLVEGNPKTYTYNTGQILAHFEIAAALFNRSIMTDAAAPILRDHIVEVFSRLQSSEEGKELMQECCSSSSTYVELRKFVSKHLPTALNVLAFEEGRVSGSS